MSRGWAVLCCLVSLVSIVQGCGESKDTPPAPERLASVVFDIDGTLTLGPGLIDSFIARPDASRAVEMYVKKGYGVVYLTARPDLIRGATQDWLRRNEFPDLPLFMAETILADDPETEAYKLTTLMDLAEREQRVFLYGYGDSTTDFNAYNRAGIPVDHTFALLRRGEAACQEGHYKTCLGGYTEHLAYIQEQPDAR